MMVRALRLLPLLVASTLAIAVTPAGATVASPASDPFYTQPSPMPSVPAGTILRERPSSVTALGIPTNIRAYEIAYASTDGSGAPVMDVGTILVPNGVSGPRPLLSYQVAEDAVTENCAPSYTLQSGTEIEAVLMAAALQQGWDVVVPDYEGLQSEYTGGRQSGQAVLDGIRAAESFAPAGLSGSATPVGMWGYSGGALASAWASELAPSYAPGLNVKGVAEGGVPVNVIDVAHNVNGGPFSGVYFDAAIGLSRAFPQLINLGALINPLGQAMVAAITPMCPEEYIPVFALQNIQIYTKGFQDPLSNPGVQQAAAQDTLGQHRPAGPLFIYQSANDELVGYSDAAALAARYCSEGVTVDMVRDLASEHVTLAVTGAGAALNYLIARFAGQPPPSTCASGPTTVTSALVQPSSNLVTTLTALAGLTGFF